MNIYPENFALNSTTEALITGEIFDINSKYESWVELDNAFDTEVSVEITGKYVDRMEVSVSVNPGASLTGARRLYVRNVVSGQTFDDNITVTI